jgi:sugar lactone lactonase YvrE
LSSAASNPANKAARKKRHQAGPSFPVRTRPKNTRSKFIGGANENIFHHQQFVGHQVDRQGNLYVSGPGGLWIISPEAKHLGTIIAPRHPHNMALGADYGRTLYMTAQGSLYRMPLNIPGVQPGCERW